MFPFLNCSAHIPVSFSSHRFQQHCMILSLQWQVTYPSICIISHCYLDSVPKPSLHPQYTSQSCSLSSSLINTSWSVKPYCHNYFSSSLPCILTHFHSSHFINSHLFCSTHLTLLLSLSQAAPNLHHSYQNPGTFISWSFP